MAIDYQRTYGINVTSPPVLPTVVYDGDCAFCRRWVARWKERSGDRMIYVSYQEGAGRFPEVALDGFRSAIHLIEPSGRVTHGLRAVLVARALTTGQRGLLWTYQKFPLLARVAEVGYCLTASHRGLANFADLALLGPNTLPVSHQATRRWFLRFLGLIYIIAFVSLWVQIDGLVGSRGILPIGGRLHELSAKGIGFFHFPTLLWINSSDAMLSGLCAAGVAMAVMLMFRIVPVFAAFGAWLCYLSLTIGGQDFLGFQWDALLLEAGFLAIFLSPLQLVPHTKGEPRVSRVIIWLYRWLLFRLVFLAGAVKFFGGDPTWHDLTALQYHYWTQPLPPWTAWYVNLLPNWFQQVSVVGVFFCELVVPWFFFAPRQPRRLALWFTVGFQSLIIVTGNFGFFNWLTLALAFLLIDDTFWPFSRRPEPIKVVRPFFPAASETAAEVIEGTPLDEPPAEAPRRLWIWPAFVTVPIAAFLVFVTSVFALRAMDCGDWIPSWANDTAMAVAPFDSANPYGLFKDMTTRRPEIIIEGSNDGVQWKPYEFKYKPGDLYRRPEFRAPYMPRLDWQMWFAGLELERAGITPENLDVRIFERYWLGRFLKRLLEASPQVAELMGPTPFGDRPPRYIRATIYNYEFTTYAEGRKHGAWWWCYKSGIGTGPLLLDAKGQLMKVNFAK